MTPHGDSTLSRRRMLEGIGMTGAAVVLTGCANQSGGGDESGGTEDGGSNAAGTSGSESGGTPVESTWEGVLTKPGNEGQHNPWSKNYNFHGFFLYDFLGRYHGNRQEFVGFIADDWTIEGTTASVHLRDTYTWHNGDPVTADDLVTQLEIEALVGSPFDTVESWEKTGERTVEFTLSKPANDFMLQDQLLRRRLKAKDSIYGEFAERARNASTTTEGNSEEQEQIIKDLQEMELQFGADKHPIGNGPWQYENATNQAWTFTLYDNYDNGHFSADQRNFDQAGWRYIPSKSKRSLALANDEIDYWTKTHPTESQIDQQPEGVEYNKVPVYNGYGLVANLNKKPWDDRRVRQAMLYAIDFDLVAKNTSGAYQRTPIEIPCGVSDSVLDTYLGDAQDQYLTYDQNLDKAASLLKAAGLTKEGGAWYKPNGEKFAPTIKEGRGGYWVSLGQNVTSQLQNFGIEAQLQKVGHTQMYGDIVPNGSFDVIGDWWSGLWFRGGYPGYHIRSVTIGWWSDQTNFPEKVDIPMPVGEESGSMETVDVVDLFEKLSTAQANDEEQRLNRKAAWVYNMTLPKMPITVEHDINLFDTKNWKLPALDGELMQQGDPHWWVDRMGAIEARMR